MERADAVTPETVFELGSISKQFTAALILKLAEESRLSVHDPVARHPDFTHLPPGLTIRHFLTHTQRYVGTYDVGVAGSYPSGAPFAAPTTGLRRQR